MGKLEVSIDASLIAKAYKQGLYDGFALAVETPEIDEQLNIKKIDDPKEDVEGI